MAVSLEEVWIPQIFRRYDEGGCAQPSWAAFEARYEHVQTEREPYDATKTAQARCFDALRMPFTVRPDIGAVVGVVGEPHHGKWTFDASGGVVARLTHS